MDMEAFHSLAATDYADGLPREQIMDPGIRSIWQPAPRIAGPAYPVRCAPNDNVMLHAAIYRAPPGSVVVCQAGDQDYAVAGGNVCCVAQRRGIAGFVIDGLVRDLGEIRHAAFPVYARGVVPKPGSKRGEGLLNGTVWCGGVEVAPGDIVIADEEGIAVLPAARALQLLAETQQRVEKQSKRSLDDWESSHRALVDSLLERKGDD